MKRKILLEFNSTTDFRMKLFIARAKLNIAASQNTAINKLLKKISK